MPLKGIVDEAMQVVGDSVEHVIVLKRADEDTSMRRVATSRGTSSCRAATAKTAATSVDGSPTSRRSSSPRRARPPSPSSRSTPTAATRSTSPRMARLVLRSASRRTCGGRRSDIGWIVGHSYIVYAPLLIGCTTLAFEGALDYPRADATLAARPSRSSASPASSRRRPPSAC